MYLYSDETCFCNKCTDTNLPICRFALALRWNWYDDDLQVTESVCWNYHWLETWVYIKIRKYLENQEKNINLHLPPVIRVESGNLDIYMTAQMIICTWAWSVAECLYAVICNFCVFFFFFAFLSSHFFSLFVSFSWWWWWRWWCMCLCVCVSVCVWCNKRDSQLKEK